MWGKQAEIAQEYLKKGSLVFVEGRIQSREWQDKEGQKRTSFEIVGTNFRMLDRKPSGNGTESSQREIFDGDVPQQEATVTDDDIPF